MQEKYRLVACGKMYHFEIWIVHYFLSTALILSPTIYRSIRIYLFPRKHKSTRLDLYQFFEPVTGSIGISGVLVTAGSCHGWVGHATPEACYPDLRCDYRA